MESNSNSRGTLSWLALLLLLITVTMTLVPGSYSISPRAVAPGDFINGDPLQVKVSKLTSPNTQLSYDFYSLGYCKPSKIIDTVRTWEEFLEGARFQNSVYAFAMSRPELCTVACRVKLDAEAAKNFKEKIDDDYRVNMNLGNLPVKQGKEKGFRVGMKGTYYPGGEEVYFIHNHLSFRVVYRRNPKFDSAQVVGFEVDPYSFKHGYECSWPKKHPPLKTCKQSTNVTNQAILQRIETNAEVFFTYDVHFYESNDKPRVRNLSFPVRNLISRLIGSLF